MLYRLILAEWKKEEGWSPRDLSPVIEADLTEQEVLDYNKKGYNCYTILNNSSTFEPGRKDENGKSVYIDGHDIDTFNYVFVDMDLKDGTWESKEKFVEALKASTILPTAIVDSGNGIHAYWRVLDLDSMSFIRLQRRLCRMFKTDETVATIYRLMRVPGTYNVKDKDNFKMCSVLESYPEAAFTCEDLDKAVPVITPADEEYCKKHYDQTYNLEIKNVKVDEEIPLKFQTLMRTNAEAKKLFMGPVKDRSSADYRLAHLMLAQSFTKEEARAVLLNTSKAISRSGIHRFNYANNIVDKVWTYETAPESSPERKALSQSIEEILNADGSELGRRIYGHPVFDAHFKGFRLGQVIGLVGGSGIGKSTLALNFFAWFIERNPDYVHVYVPLEEPKEDIARKAVKITKNNPLMLGKIKVIGSTSEDGQVRRLSLFDIEEEIKQIEKSGKKVGCVVIDHIGVLEQKDAEGKYYRDKGLEKVCADMNAFVRNTKSLLIMLSQTSRAKAGIGDIELDKDAAFGTVFFEAYCDYVITTWQPLKRVYKEAPHMTVNGFKYCKIRHKTVGKDLIYEDQIYAMMFDPESDTLRELTESEYESYDYWNKQATTIRNRDKRKDMTSLNRVDWDTREGKNGTGTDGNSNQS